MRAAALIVDDDRVQDRFPGFQPVGRAAGIVRRSLEDRLEHRDQLAIGRRFEGVCCGVVHDAIEIGSQRPLHRKTNGELKSEALKATLFVPMTGEAEAQRQLQPDPEHPAIANGSFEEVLKDKESGVETPAGWHYQRQLALVDDPSKARDGKRYITFRNEQPGRGCQALQGFAVDGRKVAKLRLAFSVRGHDVQPGDERAGWQHGSALDHA